MKKIIVYTTIYCPYCDSAKRLLKSKGLDFVEIALDDKPDLRKKISDENNGYRTVPMIFIDDEFVGGFTELAKLSETGKL